MNTTIRLWVDVFGKTYTPVDLIPALIELYPDKTMQEVRSYILGICSAENDELIVLAHQDGKPLGNDKALIEEIFQAVKGNYGKETCETTFGTINYFL